MNQNRSLGAIIAAVAAHGLFIDTPASHAPLPPRGPSGKTKQRIKDKAAKKARKANRRKA